MPAATEARTERRPDPLVRVDHLRVNYAPEICAIDGLSLAIADGEFVCIVGPSGCGKSTLMHVLGGLIPPTAGTVEIAGTALTSGNAGPMPRRVGYVFQDHRLLPWRTVRQNMELALAAAGIPRERWQELVSRYLGMLEIEAFETAWPMQLSGGQRQRAAIARALAIEPAFLLMDEPFSTLDEVTARTIRGELLRVWHETGKAVIFVTHSIREAVYLADRVVVLTRGPGRVLDVVDIDHPRPREYEGAATAEMEQRIVMTALTHWGLE